MLPSLRLSLKSTKTWSLFSGTGDPVAFPNQFGRALRWKVGKTKGLPCCSCEAFHWQKVMLLPDSLAEVTWNDLCDSGKVPPPHPCSPRHNLLNDKGWYYHCYHCPTSVTHLLLSLSLLLGIVCLRTIALSLPACRMLTAGDPR